MTGLRGWLCQKPSAGMRLAPVQLALVLDLHWMQ